MDEQEDPILGQLNDPILQRLNNTPASVKVTGAFGVGKQTEETKQRQAQTKIGNEFKSWSDTRLKELQADVDSKNQSGFFKSQDELDQYVANTNTQFNKEQQDKITQLSTVKEEPVKLPEPKKDAGFFESFAKGLWNWAANKVPKQYYQDVAKSTPSNYDELVDKFEGRTEKFGVLTEDRIKSTPLEELITEYSTRQDAAGKDTYNILLQAKNLKSQDPELVYDFYKTKVNSILSKAKERFKEEKITKQDKEEKELMKNIPQDLSDFGRGYVGSALGEGIASSLLFATNSPMMFRMEKQDALQTIRNEKSKIYSDKFGVNISPEEIENLEGDTDEGIANAIATINTSLEFVGNITAGVGKIAKTLFLKKAGQELTEQVVKKGVGDVLKSAGSGLLWEGGTEWTQNINQQVASKMAAGLSMEDALAQVDHKEAINSFLRGAIPGAGFGAVSSTVEIARDNAIKTVNKDIENIEESIPLEATAIQDQQLDETITDIQNAKSVSIDEGSVPQTGTITQASQDQSSQGIQQSQEEAPVSTETGQVEFIPAQESTVKGNIRETIRPSSPEVVTNEYTLLKDKIRNLARGSRIGNIEAKKAIKGIGKELQSIIEKQQLSKSAQNQLLRRATSVNFNNPTQVERLFDFTDKLVQDAAYSDKLEKSKSIAKTIASKARGGKFASFTPMVKRLLQIDPETLSAQDFETYQEVINSLNQKHPDVLPLKTNIDKFTFSLTDPEIQSAISIPQVRNIIQDIPQVSDIESFTNAKRKLTQAKAKLYQLVSQELTDPMEAESFANEIDNLESQLNDTIGGFQEEAEQFKQQRAEQAKEVLNNLPEYSKQDTEQINKFKNIDLSNKSVSEVEDYYQIADGLRNGFLNKSMYDYISKSNKEARVAEYKDIAIKASEEFDKVRKFFGLFNVGNINPTKDPRKLLNELKLLHGQRWDRKFLLGKERPIQQKIFTPINAKASLSETETNKTTRKAKKLISPLKEDSRIKVGMLLNQLDYESSLYKEGLPKDKIRWLISDANSWEDAKPVLGIKLLDTYKRIWESLPKDENGDLDVQQAINNLSPVEKKAFNGIKDDIFGNEDFQGKAKVITEMRGGVFTPHANYFPNYVRQRVRKGKDADTSSDSFVDDALSMDSRGLGVRSGRTYKRTGQLYFTELDLSKVVDKTIKEVNRDYYLTEAIRDNIGALNLVANQLQGDQRGMFDAMYQAMKDRVVTEYNLKFQENDPLSNFMNWYLSFRRTMALSNPLRVPYDFTANMVRQGVAEGFNASTFTNPLWAELAKANDSVITGKTNKYRQEQVRPTETKSGEIADTLMGLGDVPVVKISYVGSFKNKFKELTGIDFNIEDYNDLSFREQYKEQIKQASSFADAKVQDLFNSQTTFMAPSKTKITPFDTALTDKKTVVARMFGFMQSFTTNESAEMIQSFRDLAYGTNEGRITAARKLAALGMSNYVYLNGALVMSNVLRAGLDKDKELDDLLIEQFSPERQFEILLASVGSLAVGRYGNLVRPILSLMLGGLYDMLKQGNFTNESELKKDLDVISDISNTTFFTGKPINLRYDKPEKALRLFPVLGDALADAFVLGNSITDLVSKDPETMNEEERATYDMLILLNKTVAFAYKNPVSPTIDRLLKYSKPKIEGRSKSTGVLELPTLPPPPSIPSVPSLPPLPQ